MRFLLLLLLALQESSTPFTEQVSALFDAWDRNADGTLQGGELDALVEDPSITGKTAATLAALKIVERGNKWTLGPYTRELFSKYAAAKKQGLKKEEWPNFDALYAGALRRIQRCGPAVFAEGQPRLEDVNQGTIGDCFFLAPLGALVHRDPERVRGMIRDNGDGTFTVRFGDGSTVRVAAPSDTELAMSSSTDRGGRWVPIFEKAFATVRNNERPESKQKESETDVIARGGAIGPSIRTLTGRPFKQFPLRTRGKTDPPKDGEVEAKLPKLREILLSSIEERRLACCGTPKMVATPGVNGKHAYAVIGFDEKEDAVRLWNPHGNNFKPKGEPGLKNGYETRDGLFTIPLADFVRIFNGVSYEES